MSRADVRSEISLALNQPAPENIIEGVKRAVARQVEALNPHATITYTNYFNHTSVPDMIVKWGSESRPLFVRYDIDDAETARDAGGLTRERPILMAVAAPGQLRDEDVRLSLENDPGVLTTHVETVADLNDYPTTGPLDSLLRESVLSSGRGLLDEADVDLSLIHI